MTAGCEPLVLEGVFSRDARGDFHKPYPLPASSGIDFEVREIFWSSSAKGVIRGMHFQFVPDDVAKIIWVSQGSIHDVLVDLREGEAFGTTSIYPLDSRSGRALYVPSGFAHGYQSLEDGTIVSYAQDGVFSPARDAGIRWDTIGVDWPLIPTEISIRDMNHPALNEFSRPFPPLT